MQAKTNLNCSVNDPQFKAVARQFAQQWQPGYAIPAATGPSFGIARVEVRWLRKTGKRLPTIPPAPPGTIEETIEALPARYNSQSELKAEITPGENQVSFDLKSK